MRDCWLSDKLDDRRFCDFLSMISCREVCDNCASMEFNCYSSLVRVRGRFIRAHVQFLHDTFLFPARRTLLVSELMTACAVFNIHVMTRVTIIKLVRQVISHVAPTHRRNARL